jgi:anti-sigma factor ChrR (cupin superfamily)
MSRAPNDHGEAHAELLLLYALQALPPGEVEVAEAQISACSACRHEMEMVRPIIDAFASWPTDVLRPTASLWARVARRIQTDTGEATSPSPEPSAEPEWKNVAPGIACKLLATDADNDRVSMLVRLAPDTEYPPHRHAGVEELHLLNGELMIGDRRLYPGDYNRAEPGTVDHRVWSDTGCTCVLITSFRDAIL